jgi:hypothetical protein
MKRNLTAPSNEEPAIEISPEFDAAMDKLTELFSDPSMPVPPADFRCNTEGPTEKEIMDETIFGEENSEYRRWIRRLYGLGLISRMPSEWEAPEVPEGKSPLEHPPAQKRSA